MHQILRFLAASGAWLAAMCAALPANSDTNLLKNGDFESQLQAWRSDEALSRVGGAAVERDPKRGSMVLHLRNTSAEAVVGLSQPIAVREAKAYVLRGFCRSTKLQEGAGIAFHCLDARGHLVRRVWVHQIPSWGALHWQPLWGRFRPPKGTASVRVKLVIYKKGEVWLDDLSVVETDPPKRTSVKGRPLTDAGIAVTHHRAKRPVYAMDVDDLDGNGAPDFVLADIDGVVRRQDEAGQVLWERDMAGMALALDCGDVNRDGNKDVAVCTSDIHGTLRVMNHLGETLWTHVAPGAIFGRVHVADVTGDGACEVFATYGNQLVALSSQGKVLWQKSFGGPRFRGIAVGDVNRDGQPDVVATMHSQKLFAAAFDRNGKSLWVYKPLDRKRLNPDDVVVADLDRDGRAEVVLACAAGLVICLRDGKALWAAPRERHKLWAKHRDATARFGGYETQIAVADYCADRPGQETLVTLLDTAWLLDSRGKRIWEGDSGLLLRDLCPGPSASVYIPSSGLRDRSFYRLALVRGQGSPLAAHTVPNPIYDTLDRLHASVSAMGPLPQPAEAEGKFHVIYAALLWPFSKYGSLERLRTASDALKATESEHLEFILMLWPKDLPVELHRGGMMEQREILKVVEFLEDLNRPFLFFADHGCSPNLSLDTIEKTLRMAPNACRGMYVAENTAHYATPKWDAFVDWAMKVMDLCQRYGGKQVVFKEMFESWAFLPSDPQVMATLLAPKYRDTLVPIYATNNPYAPELQVGGMAGLAHAGLVQEWGISTQYWNWSWDAHRTAQKAWPYCPADCLLSMELSTACLGGRWFHVEGGQEYLERGTGKLSDRAKRHRDLVYHLIRKNVLLPLPHDRNESFSPVVLARRFHPLATQRREEGLKMGSPYARPEGPLRSGFLGVKEALQTTLPEYFPAYAYGHRRYTQTMTPRTPYGYVRIVPDVDRVSGFLAGKRAIVTDGCHVFIDGKRLPASQAKPLVLAALEQGAASLPLAAPGAALFVHRLDRGRRVFLLDPGYMCPTGVDTALRPRAPRLAWAARDVITGEAIPIRDGRAAAAVEPGAFRVIDVEW